MSSKGKRLSHPDSLGKQPWRSCKSKTEIKVDGVRAMEAPETKAAETEVTETGEDSASACPNVTAKPRKKNEKKKIENKQDEDDDSDNVGGEYYEVERIISHCMRNGRTEYYVKWKGFPDVYNSWEPRRNIRCLELMRDYMRKPRALARSYVTSIE